MNFENDPISNSVEKEMKSLRAKGVEFENTNIYNRVFEAFYDLHKKIEALAGQDNTLAKYWMAKHDATSNMLLEQINDLRRKNEALERNGNYSVLYAWLQTMKVQADKEDDLYHDGKASAYNDVLLYLDELPKEPDANDAEEYTIRELSNFSQNNQQ